MNYNHYMEHNYMKIKPRQINDKYNHENQLLDLKI